MCFYLFLLSTCKALNETKNGVDGGMLICLSVKVDLNE